MTTYLLDANVLIALTSREHVHHDRVSRWMADIHEFALCPIIEGAFVRFSIRLGADVSEAREVLGMIRQHPSYSFWLDDLSYSDISMDHVTGHRQVTDAYLIGLVRARPETLLATLDEGLLIAAPSLTSEIPS